MKKIISILMMVVFSVALLACGDTTDTTNTGTDTTDAEETTKDLSGAYDTVTQLADGYTSLAIQYDNGAIAADGTYTVGGVTFNTVDTYQTTYTTEPKGALFNYLTNSWTYNSTQYTNMVDGLVENDKHTEIVECLAIGYKVVENTDGTQSWTFQLREDVPWVYNETGEVFGEVTAEDFVAGIKYVLDPINGSATAGIVFGLLEGAQAYYMALADDEVADLSFDTVGVKAISKYEVEYTLSQSTPFFLSSLTYSPFLPVSQDYLDLQGTDFGLSANDILVNGAFRITTHVKENVIVYTANDTYWDAAHVYVNTVVRRYLPRTASASTTREWYEAGSLDAFTVSAQDDIGYEDYVEGEAGTGTTASPANANTNAVLQAAGATYTGYFNYARVSPEYNESTTVGMEVITKSAAQIANATEAVKNVNFRKGFLYGLDMLERLEWYRPNEPYLWLMRAYTIRELCNFEGKDYADYVDDVYNEKEGTTGITLTGINQLGDPIYDATAAGTYFATAKTELMNGGLLEADFPIYIDVIGDMDPEVQAYEVRMYDRLEANSNGIVKIQYNIPLTDEQDGNWGSIDHNYDFSLWSGWGPDYADPQTFLHTMIVGGDMVDAMGFVGASTAALEEEILGDYTDLYDIGAAITDLSQLEARYEAFAQAEYSLIYDYAIIVPWLGTNGYAAVVSNAVPNRAGKASYGLTEDKYKNVICTDGAITQTQRTAVLAAYDAEYNPA